MSLTINQSATASPSGFTSIEVAKLVAWGGLCGLELVIKPAGADFGGAIAVVGYGESIPSWAIYRAAGEMWIDFIPDSSEQEFESYTIQVASVEDAMAQIIADTEAWVGSDKGMLWAWGSVVHGSGGGAEAPGDVGDHPSQYRMPILPFKLNQDRRHHIPRQQHKVTNWPAYDASLRQRGSLTLWFTDEAIAAWRAEARTTRGGQPWYSPLAILTALTLRAVFRLAYRKAEGLLGSIISLLGLGLRVPDHTTLSRRAATLDVPRPGNAGAGVGSEPLQLLVDSTGLKLCGKGEWLLEKHGTATRRSWRALHLGVDAETGRIVACTLTRKEVDDASQAGALLDQVAGAVASFTGDGGYDQDRVYADVAQRHPDAAVVVPPRATAVPSDTAETAPTQRDGHLQDIANHGRMARQNASGYNKRARVEATMNRWKQVIGDELRAHTDERRATEVAVAVHALNRMLELGRPSYVRVA